MASSTNSGTTNLPNSFFSGASSPAGSDASNSFYSPLSPATVGGGSDIYAASQAQAAAGSTGLTAPSDSSFDTLAGSKVMMRAYNGSQLSSQLMDAQQYANQWWSWTQDDVNSFRSQLGLVNSAYLTADNQTLYSAWLGYVSYAAKATANGSPTNPMDVIQSEISQGLGPKGTKGTTQTRDISSVTHTSAPDANALFNAAAQSLLGRQATDQELASFRNNLYGLEQANPTNQTIQETISPSGFITDKNVLKQSGGISSAAQQNLALQQAKQNPEYGAYQAATTYMGALQQLLSGGQV